MTRQLVQVSPGGLLNSVGERRVPLSRAWRMDNCTTERDRFEVGPRYGDVWDAPTSIANMSGSGSPPSGIDTAYSIHYGSYRGTSEVVVVAKEAGGTNASAFVVSVSTGAWTKIDHGDADDGLEDAFWVSAQYRDWLYFVNSASGKMYKRKIGSSGTVDENWMEWHPLIKTIARTSSATATIPPYTQTSFDSSITVTAVTGLASKSTLFGRTVARLTNAEGPNGAISVKAVVTLPSTIDLSSADRHHFVLYSNSELLISDISVRFTEDGAGTINAAYIAAMQKCRVYKTGKRIELGSGIHHALHMVVDLSDIPPASRNAVKRIAFTLDCAISGPVFGSLTTNLDMDFIGGGAMWGYVWRDLRGQQSGAQYDDGVMSEAVDPIGVHYAYGYYDSSASPPVYVSCQTLEIEPGVIQGQYLPADSWWDDQPGDPTPRPSMGASVALAASADAGLNAAGYDKVAFFRRRPDTGQLPLVGGPNFSWDGKWVRIDDGSVANSGSPAWTDTKSWEELAVGTSTAVDPDYMTFDGIFTDISATAIAAWKNHLVLGEGRKLWFSFNGNTGLFMPDPESEIIFIPEPGDFSAGRTVYLSDDRVDEAQCFAARDVFYAASARDTFSMAGDNAFTATAPRRLHGSRGAVSLRGAIPFRDGVIVGAYDGLWYLQDPRPGSNLDPVSEELTFGVRDDWRRIIGQEDDWAGLVAVEWEDEVWLFNDTTLDEDLAALDDAQHRFLRLTRQQPGQQAQRRTESGSLPSKVVGAVAVSGLGMRVLFEDGSIGRFVRGTDGAKYDTDGGADVAWSYQTGREPLPMSTRVVAVKCVAQGTPTITIDVYPGKGSTTPSQQIVLHEDSTVWEKNVSIAPGHEVQVTVSGTQVDAVDYLALVVESEAEGYGA